MSRPRDGASWSVATAICIVTLCSLLPLLLSDVFPGRFAAIPHGVLAAAPLVLIAVACIARESRRQASRADLAQAILLASAFLFWAANQLWPDHPLSTVFNDVAILGFVIDVFLVVARRPAATVPSSPSESRSNADVPSGANTA